MSFETKITATMSEFNRAPSRVARMTHKGPVLITDRGRPALVAMTYEAYLELKGSEPSETLYDVFSRPHPASGLDFDPEFPDKPGEPFQFD